MRPIVRGVVINSRLVLPANPSAGALPNCASVNTPDMALALLRLRTWNIRLHLLALSASDAFHSVYESSGMAASGVSANRLNVPLW